MPTALSLLTGDEAAFRTHDVPNKLMVCLSPGKLIREGSEFMVKTLDDTYNGLSTAANP